MPGNDERDMIEQDCAADSGNSTNIDGLVTQADIKKNPDTEETESVEQVEDAVSNNDNNSVEGAIENTTKEADENIIYRWDYKSQAEHDSQNHTDNGRRGVKVYALIVTVAFVISFAILAFVLIMNSRTSPDTSNATALVQTIKESYNSTVVVSVTTPTGSGTGSGVIISSDGYIVTNAHVVNNATHITVLFYDNKQREAKIVGMSVSDDVALIKVNATGLRPAPIGDSSKCLSGEDVFAIGSPAGVDFAWTVTKGSVSYPNRWLKESDDASVSSRKIKVIQTDTIVNKGNSGGPLFNTNGEVIGIVTLKLVMSNGNSYDGLGFALPINEVMVVVNELKAHGNADGIDSPLVTQRPMIGITGIAVTKDSYYFIDEAQFREITKEEYEASPEKGIHAEESGVYVVSLTEGFDAANHLRVGDCITEINDVRVYSVQNISNIINNFQVGDTVNVKFLRDGKVKTAKITLNTEK